MSSTRLEFRPVKGKQNTVIAQLTLARPQAANAFHDDMMTEISAHIAKAQDHPACRALILRADGKHFSAGADLEWMKAAARFSAEENLQSTKTLSEMFRNLYEFPYPTIAAVHGAVYGGAVGLVACCDVTVGAASAKFCLSEVKLGLLPAVILPYLKLRMSPGALRRLSLTAKLFDTDEAKAFGLLDVVCPTDTLTGAIDQEVNRILAGGPLAQQKLKALNRALDPLLEASRKLAVEAIAEARTGEEGQHGLAAFFDKKAPDWTGHLEP